MSNQASLGDISTENNAQEETEDSGDYFRFPIPLAWEVRPMSKIGDIQGGSTPKTGKEEYWDGEIPWLTPTEVTESRKIEISETERNITEEGYESTSTHLMPENSLLLTTRATIGSALINKVPMCTNQGFQNIEPEDDVNTLYLYYQVRHAADYLDSLGSGSTFNEISKSMLKNVELPVPEKDEQRRIASVLYNVDQAIQKTEEIIMQTRRVKKGLMQDLFTEGYYSHEEFQETKYGDAPADWKVKKISDVAENIQAGGTPNTDKEEYYGGEIPWVKTGELKQDVVTETEQTITKEGFENSTARKFPEGTVLVAMYGATTGETSRLGIEATTNQACCGIQVNSEIDGYFLHQQLEFFNENLIALSAGSGQQNIRKSTIVNFDVLVPPKEEQKGISETLRNIQRKLNKHSEEKQQLQTLKKGLMQDLLTGEVRTGEDVRVLDPVVEVEG